MAPVDPAEKSQQRSTMQDSRKQQKMASLCLYLCRAIKKSLQQQQRSWKSYGVSNCGVIRKFFLI